MQTGETLNEIKLITKKKSNVLLDATNVRIFLFFLFIYKVIIGVHPKTFKKFPFTLLNLKTADTDDFI